MNPSRGRSLACLGVGLGWIWCAPLMAGTPQAPPPTVSKFFSTPAILVNGTATVGLTLNEQSGFEDATGVTVSDALPAGLVVATPSNATNGCGGTLTATPGATSFSLVGGTILTGKSCTITVEVTGTTPGQKDNTSSAPSSTEGGTGGPSLVATLQVLPPATLAKAFGSPTIPVGGSTTLTFTVDNPGPSALIGFTFTDALPAGLSVATPNGLAGACLTAAGGVTNAAAVTATSGSTSVSMAALNLAAASSCQFSVTVQGDTFGVKNNNTSALTYDFDGGNFGLIALSSAGASAAVTVNGPALAIAKTHAGAFQQGVTGEQYTITVSNVGTGATVGTVTVTDSLPAGLTATGMTGIGWTCSVPPSVPGPAALGCTSIDAIVASASYPPITLTVTVDPAAPPTVTNVAQASGGGDPGTAVVASDPTAIGAVSITQVPTLGGTGLAILCAVLALAGWMMARRRRTP
ncbi:MAG: hypothetical protein ABI609_10730 [Acidobacteriota bacterium]